MYNYKGYTCRYHVWAHPCCCHSQTRYRLRRTPPRAAAYSVCRHPSAGRGKDSWLRGPCSTTLQEGTRCPHVGPFDVVICCSYAPELCSYPHACLQWCATLISPQIPQIAVNSAHACNRTQTDNTTMFRIKQCAGSVHAGVQLPRAALRCWAPAAARPRLFAAAAGGPPPGTSNRPCIYEKLGGKEAVAAAVDIFCEWTRGAVQGGVPC
jgi:hypothetical protein